MKSIKEHHFQQLRKIVNPEQRAKYYKQFIDNDVVNLSTAENVLLLDFYQKQNIFDKLPVISATDTHYPSSVYGSPEYRQSILEFLGRQWSLPNGTITSDNIYIVSGVSAALECLAFSLFRAADQVLIPGPMWYGFPWCFRQRPQMEFIHFPVGEDFELSRQNVEDAVQANPNARLLVLTNPNNPLGTNYRKDQLEEIYTYFLSLGSDHHIISDEIYACSQNTDSDMVGNEFVSALRLDAYDSYPNQIHVVWGLSKDFGLSGFRVGCIISKSSQVQASLDGDACNKTIAWFSPFGALNPYMLQKLFLSGGAADPTVANKAMSEYQSSLLPLSYSTVQQKLNDASIPYYPNNKGGIFFWIDLRAYLNRVEHIKPDPLLCDFFYPPNFNDPNEGKLTRYIREQAQVLLIRGQECFWSEPGWFRLCYTAEEHEQVAQGLDSMITKLNELPLASPNH